MKDWHARAAAVYESCGSLAPAAALLGVSRARLWQVLTAQGVAMRPRGRGPGAPRSADGSRFVRVAK